VTGDAAGSRLINKMRIGEMFMWLLLQPFIALYNLCTYLMTARRSLHDDLIDCHNQQTASMDRAVERELFKACCSNDVAMVTTILDSRTYDAISVEKNIGSLLHIAVSRGAESVVRYLIQCGTDVNHRCLHDDCYGTREYSNMTALHIACRAGYRRIAEILLSAGADWRLTCRFRDQTQDSLGYTPLRVSVRRGLLYMITLLVQYGCSVEEEDSAYLSRCGKNAEASSLLYLAVKEGHFEVAEYLMGQGVNVEWLEPTNPLCKPRASHIQMERLFRLRDEIYSNPGFK
jgi:hypothetical protein